MIRRTHITHRHQAKTSGLDQLLSPRARQALIPWPAMLVVAAVFLLTPPVHAEPPIQSIRVVMTGHENITSGPNADHIDTSIPDWRKLERSVVPHIGRPADEAGLGQLADVIVEHLRQQHWPVSLVTVWDEDNGFTAGRVTLQVQQGKVGDIAIVGGSPGRQQQVAEELKDLAHTPLDGLKLQRRLDALAFSPWLACTSQAVPGATLDTANLLLTLRDESPVHALLSYENNGVEPLGENRYSLGLQWLNAFAHGQELSVMSTMADDPDTFTMFSGAWRIPLPWHHELRFSGYYADTGSDAEVLGIPLEVDGIAWEAGARYVIPWRTSQHWRSEWQLGFDYKQFNTAFTFGSTAVAGDTTGVGTLVLGTQWFYDAGQNHSRLALEAAHGEPGWARGHNEDEFEELVPDASPRFTTLRADASFQHDFSNDVQAALRLGGQWSDGPVLPSEELALASVNAVRGYPERSVRASRGAWTSIELRSQPWQPPQSKIKLRAIAFADGGWIADEHSGTGFIASTGLGIRAEIISHLQFRCDLAVPLMHAAGADDLRVHIAAVLRF